jgi:hypothetical protein
MAGHGRSDVRASLLGRRRARLGGAANPRYSRDMKLMPLAVAVVLATGAVSLAAKVVTQSGVGAIEYLAAVALVAGLAVAATRMARSALRPR